MISVRYIYSACVEIKTADFSLVCDPWFTDGIYDGSWYQFPKVINPIETVGRADFVYVSHIHPDHYDPSFLKAYLYSNPKVQVIIANFTHNFLSKKMDSDGIPYKIVDELTIGRTSLKIFPNETGSISEVDSILVIKTPGYAVANVNDNPYNEELFNNVLNFSPKIDIALLPYTGAGPYPQTYYKDPEVLKEKSECKKKNFFDRYLAIKEKLRPTVTIPFAGKYILGGNRSHLNEFRGVADPVEVLAFDKNAVVLEDGGGSIINTVDLIPNSFRIKPYSKDLVQKRIEEIKNEKMSYQTYFNLPSTAIPWRKLLPRAYANALTKTESVEDFFFCIEYSKDLFFVMNCKKDSRFSTFVNRGDLQKFSPRSEIEIDYRYLFGLLSNIFHWNNGEIGSQYYVRREPDVFRREVQRFLNFFHL